MEAYVLAQRRKGKGFNTFHALAAASSAVPFQAFRGQSRSISSDNERLNSSGGFLVSPYTTYLYAPTHAPQPPAFVTSTPVESSLSIDTVFGFTGTLPSMMAAVDSSDIVCVPMWFPRLRVCDTHADMPVEDCVLSCPTRHAARKSSIVIRAPSLPSACTLHPPSVHPPRKVPTAALYFGVFLIAVYYPSSPLTPRTKSPPI